MQIAVKNGLKLEAAWLIASFILNSFCNLKTSVK